MKKIVVLGPESTGKSTLCEQLAKHYNTCYVPEYARTYFDEHDINNYTIDDLDVIARQQLADEKTYAQKASGFLFCDTSLITIKIWSAHMFNKVSRFVAGNIKPSDYDLYLVCNNDIAWIEDAQRRNENLREHLLTWNEHELQKLNVDYTIISGTGDERLQYAIEAIDKAFGLRQ